MTEPATSNDRSPAALADGLETAMSSTATLASELRDAPTGARETAASLSATIGDIIRTGHETAANVAAIRTEAAELSKKGGHEAARLRNLDADQAQGAAIKAVDDLYQRAQGSATSLRRNSGHLRVPQVGTDPSRTLARQELLQAIGPDRGISAASKLIRLCENADLSPAVVAEMYSTFGEGYFRDSRSTSETRDPPRPSDVSH